MLEVKLIPLGFEGNRLEKRLENVRFTFKKEEKKLYCIKHGDVITRAVYFSSHCYNKQCNYLVNYGGKDVR